MIELNPKSNKEPFKSCEEWFFQIGVNLVINYEETAALITTIEQLILTRNSLLMNTPKKV